VRPRSSRARERVVSGKPHFQRRIEGIDPRHAPNRGRAASCLLSITQTVPDFREEV
jgi:hypothetical protein